MVVRVPVRAALLEWASSRSRIAPDELSSRFPDLGKWEQGTKQPTLKQLEKFANATHTPIGYLFLPHRRKSRYRCRTSGRSGDAEVAEASPDLLDTVYQCQQRQDWYRDYARVRRRSRCRSSAPSPLDTDVIEAADAMRQCSRSQPRIAGRSWSEALRRLIEEADRHGVLVMVSGIVGSNNHRKLDPEEFRGFALADDLAPLVFVNGADTKSGADLHARARAGAYLAGRLGGVGRGARHPSPAIAREVVQRGRGRVSGAARVLAPRAAAGSSRSTSRWRGSPAQFKVSTLVVLRRLFDAGALNRPHIERASRRAGARPRLHGASRRGRGGGDFYQHAAGRGSADGLRGRSSRARWKGRRSTATPSSMLGFKKLATFNEYATGIGVIG